jgi:hypothetical protein
LSPLASPLLSEKLREQIQGIVYGGFEDGNVAPPCKEQTPLGPRLTDTPGVYPHVEAAPER